MYAANSTCGGGTELYMWCTGLINSSTCKDERLCITAAKAYMWSLQSATCVLPYIHICKHRYRSVRGPYPFINLFGQMASNVLHSKKKSIRNKLSVNISIRADTQARSKIKNA